MFDLEPIFQFSRNNCITICAFLVPANLLTTVQTFIMVVSQRSPLRVRLCATVAVTFALTLFLHVATWFMIGVITPVTFILAGLGATCIIINLILVVYQSRFGEQYSALQERSLRSLREYLLEWKQTIKKFAQ